MQPVSTLYRNDLPCIDLLSYSAGMDRDKEIEKARRAISELGFLVLERYPVDRDLLKQCYRVGASFFDLDADEKALIGHKTIDQKEFGNVGYYSFMLEQAVGARAPDLKEFLHVGPLIDADHPMSRHYPVNAWPERPPALRACFEQLYQQMEACGKQVLDLVGAAMGMDRDYLDDLLETGNSILRMLHYPAVEQHQAEQGAMRAAPHTGINLLGLLPAASHAGLQFCTPNKQWVCLDPELHDSCLAVNLGEMLSFLLPTKIQPTLHQVINPEQDSGSERRFSIVYFVHPNSIKPLVPVDGSGARQHEQAVQAGRWLLERLNDINIRNS